MNQKIVFDLYIFNDKGELLVNSSSVSVKFNSKSLRPIIIYAKQGKHPLKQVKEYIKSKNLVLKSIEFLPSLLLNKFDTEIDVDYLVLNFKIEIMDNTLTWKWISDDMNQNVTWLDLKTFSSSTNLLPEFKDELFLDILKGKEVHYSGLYKESDGSNDVIYKNILNEIS